MELYLILQTANRIVNTAGCGTLDLIRIPHRTIGKFFSTTGAQYLALGDYML